MSDAAFVVESFDYDEGEGCFRYELGADRFEERVRFPTFGAADEPSIAAALAVAHVVLGVSYYKLRLPKVVEVTARPISDATRVMAQHVYDDGLRELAFTNGLALPVDVRIEADIRPALAPGAASAAGPPLVPVGGGKDSAAVLAMLPDATAVVVNPTPAHRKLVDAAGAPLISVERKLDARLHALTAAGGYNGHVPITAINSALCVVAATLGGFADVVMANERSADAPTRVVDGVEVNHQYSKSFAFEQLFAAAVAETNVRYFSLVRRLSDLAIAGRLAPSPRLRESILSCNTGNFGTVSAAGTQAWCGNCDKCRFTYLCFACFLEPLDLVRMFGRDLLADAGQLPGFATLVRADEKPFDCVGETVEAAAAFVELASSPRWKDHAVVRALSGEAAAIATSDDFAAFLTPTGPDLVPDAYRTILAADQPDR